MLKLWSKFQIQIVCYSFTRDHSFILPPWKILSQTSVHINDSLSMYLSLDSELYPGKSKEFNNQRIKIQVKRAFVKSYFFLQKSSNNNNKKADRLCIKFLQPSLQVCRSADVPISPFSKSTPILSTTLILFRRVSQPSDRLGSRKW